MNKLGKREYIQLIAETLVDTYGDTLIEGDTDLDMAKAVLKRLSTYLYFHEHDTTPKEFKQWRKELYDEHGME